MRPALLLACILLAGPLAAQQPAAAAPFTLPPGDLTLAQLVDLTARYLHANFVVADPQLLANPAPMTLTWPVVTDRAGCLRALAAILSTRGLALMPLDPEHGIHEIVSVNSERATVLQLTAEIVPCEKVLADPHGKQLITTVVPLRHARASQVTAALRPFFANSTVLGVTADGANLVLGGSRDLVANAIRFVEANDRPTADPATMQQLAAQIRSLRERVTRMQARLAAAQKEGK